MRIAASRLKRSNPWPPKSAGRPPGGRGFDGLRRRSIPATGRSGHVDRVFRLTFRHKGLDCELRRSQRLRIEALRHIVTLLAGIDIALGGGKTEPFEAFSEVLIDTDASGIENAEIELTVGDTMICGLAEPE